MVEPPRDAARCWRCGHLPAGGTPAVPCDRCGNVAAQAPMPSGARGFLHGLGAVPRGVGFVRAHPGLWTWIMVPLVISAVLLGIFIALGISWAEALTPELLSPWWGWIDWLRTGLQAVLPWLVGLVVVLASLTLTVMLSAVVNAPFHDLLAEKTEQAFFGRPDVSRPWSAWLPDASRATMAALYLLSRQLVVMACLFLFSFTAVGAPLFVAAGFYFTGFGLLDVTLSRKRYPGPRRVQWARRHWDLVAGAGVLVNLVPVFTPFGVVGGTLAYLDHPDKG